MKVLRTCMMNTNKNIHKDSKTINTNESNVTKTISKRYIRDAINDKKLKKTKKDKKPKKTKKDKKLKKDKKANKSKKKDTKDTKAKKKVKKNKKRKKAKKEIKVKKNKKTKKLKSQYTLLIPEVFWYATTILTCGLHV